MNISLFISYSFKSIILLNIKAYTIQRDLYKEINFNQVNFFRYT